MVELMEALAPSADDGEPAPQDLLQTIGHALLMGTPWETVLNDQRWAYRSLYIAYTHDKLGTPDNVEGVFFSYEEADARAEQLSQGFSSGNVSQHQFYKFKVAEWPLGALAIREARDSFHHGVVEQIVSQIKAALQQGGQLPQGLHKVSIGPVPDDAQFAFIDITGRRVVLWEDCCFLASADDTIDFTTHARTPLCGLMNAQGDIVVPPAFQEVSALCDGLAVAKRKGKYGYIDVGGNVAVPFIYDDAADCCQNLLLVKTGDLWGAIDRDGKEVIAAQFEALEHDVGNEALRATKDGKYAYLSLTGDLLAGYSDVPLQLVEQSFAADRSVFIAHDASLGDTPHVLVDVQGHRIGAESFTGIDYGVRDEGLLCAKMRRGQRVRYGYINLHGDAVIDFRFAAADSFSEGLAAAGVDDHGPMQFGYIDRQGNWIIAPKLHAAGEFRQGLAAASGPQESAWYQPLLEMPLVQRLLDQGLGRAFGAEWRKTVEKPAGQRFGYIDRRGKWVIDQIFLEARPFNEGMAPVRMERGWSYVDIHGRLAIAGPYHEAGPFLQGVARVARRYDGPLRYGLVDISGREIIPLRFDWLSYPKRGLITACDEFGLWGCFTLFGNIVAPFIYRQAHDLHAALTARGLVAQ